MVMSVTMSAASMSSGLALRPVTMMCRSGRRAVSAAMETNLELTSHYPEPSRLSLYRYGNVSSASIWYELELIAENGNQCGAHRPDGNLPAVPRKLRRGDRVWQIAFGSGFKCNSVVWQCMRGS